ncbi:hypothetical protein AB0N62_13540 [Streptomyces sp. NPDC093982]|uniref:hypothetical protein n=1 Tax=Streptomyces sp. NPDC093982 TaxID=3155077 RepID=UPI0034245F21
MGWENRSDDDPEGDRPGDVVRSLAELNAAAAVCAAQFPTIGLIWWAGTQQGDDYGGSYGFLYVLALAVVVLVTPLVMPFVGFAHAVAHIVPAGRLARVTARHVRGPAWAWHLVYAGALAVVWAAVTALLWSWPFLITATVLAALGVLPVLGLGHLRRRARVTGRPQGFWAVWLPSLFASVTLFLLVFVGGLLATVVGLVGYQAPALSAGQLTGVWRGADGAALRLDPGGEAELTKLPTESESGDWFADPPYTVCEGTGNWSTGRTGDRDAVVVRLDSGCGRQTYWKIGGTEGAPELFAQFGDPDAGEVWILVRG